MIKFAAKDLVHYAVVAQGLLNIQQDKNITGKNKFQISNKSAIANDKCEASN